MQHDLHVQDARVILLPHAVLYDHHVYEMSVLVISVEPSVTFETPHDKRVQLSNTCKWVHLLL